MIKKLSRLTAVLLYLAYLLFLFILTNHSYFVASVAYVAYYYSIKSTNRSEQDMKLINGLEVSKIYKDYSKMMDRKPTKIGTVGHFNFYEHPIFGDEYPLLVTSIKEPKIVGLSYFYELPTIEEIY